MRVCQEINRQLVADLDVISVDSCRFRMYSFCMYSRILDLTKTMAKSSAFLFGPRSVGKSSLVQLQFPKSSIIDLLDDSVYDQLVRRPAALIELIDSKNPLVIIDEIQKLPKLLDEVHRLIEQKKLRFLLTGSSARKLKKTGANLLGGRAREVQLFPLVYPEISDFSLMRYLNFGGIPRHYLSEDPLEDIKAYAKNYLTEEIKMEAAVRNYDRFVRFLEVMALSNGQEINYQSLSSDSGVPARTIEGHIEVLKDTLIGFELLPFQKSIKRKAITKSKFYFFDCGVANYFSQRLPLREAHSDAGMCFEHFIVLEVRAYLAYTRKDERLTFWRTRSGEVDLIVGTQVAIEIKFAKHFKPEYADGLLDLDEEKIIKKFFVVGRFETEGLFERKIAYQNYKTFLTQLWAGKII